MDARCPLCGARSTWVRFPDEDHNRRADLRSRFPDYCYPCKAEDGMHQKDWEQGIDATQYGGHPLNANVEVPGGNPTPYFKGERIA